MDEDIRTCRRRSFQKPFNDLALFLQLNAVFQPHLVEHASDGLNDLANARNARHEGCNKHIRVIDRYAIGARFFEQLARGDDKFVCILRGRWRDQECGPYRGA